MIVMKEEVYRNRGTACHAGGHMGRHQGWGQEERGKRGQRPLLSFAREREGKAGYADSGAASWDNFS